MASESPEVVQQQNTAIEPVSADEFLAAVDRRNKAIDRVLSYAIAATHPSQWMDIGGKPYATGPACESMRLRCAVSITDVEGEREEREDEKGAFYIWTYRARFALPGGLDVVHAEGHCSSRDQFLGSTEFKDGEGAKRKEWEVEEGNIRQAAYTNCTNNGITRILGVRNLSWERLCTLLGVERESFGKVDYEHGAKGGGRGKLDEEKPIPFGRAKGKRLGEAADDEIAWLLGKMKEPASDPKFQASNERWVKAIEAELARRANAKGGQGAASPAAPTIYQRILALPAAKGRSEEDLRTVIKAVTKKESSGVLVEADIALVEAALAKGEWDVKF
jgi:hypothetical protein